MFTKYIKILIVVIILALGLTAYFLIQSPQENLLSTTIKKIPFLSSASNSGENPLQLDAKIITSQTAIVETTEKRTRTSKTYNLGNGHYFYQQILNTVIHYPSANPDSNLLDAVVDFTPQRINNSQLDGWLVNQAGWHYALGTPKTGILANQDGVVGFGGRQGQNWLKFRLEKVGYLNYTDKSWQDVGGNINYNRANLSSQTEQLTLGPEGAQEIINVSNTATWRNLWTTPGSGEVSIKWRAEGRQLKEEIILNQAARDWITANRPPNTGYDWFGFVFKLDISDIPKFIKNNIVQTTDFDDSDGNIELKDDLEHLLAFMPIDYAFGTPDTEGNIPSIRLRKRIWQDGSNDWWLIVGARVSELNALPTGDIIFDPTLELQPDDTDGYDGYMRAANPTTRYGTANYTTDTPYLIHSETAGDWQVRSMLVKFDLSTLAGATINSAKLYLYESVADEWNQGIGYAYRILPANIGWVENSSYNNPTEDTSGYWEGDTGNDGGTDAGCSISGTDFDATPAFTGDNEPNSQKPIGYEFEHTADTTEFTEMVNNNHGLIVGGTWSRNYSSSDHATAGYRPKLVVDYDEPTPTPTPSPTPSPTPTPTLTPTPTPESSNFDFEGVKMEGVKIN